MGAVRQLLAQRRWAVLLCAATLLLKLMVPTGYMVDSAHGRLAIAICPGTAPATPATTMAGPMPMAMPGMHGAMPDHGKTADHAGPEMPCAFAGLSAAVLDAVDPILLAGLIAFVLALGFVAVVARAVPRHSHLRPPLRGPPALL